MPDYQEQILRIKRKLVEAKKTDTLFKVFGSDYHKYIIHAPASRSEILAIENEYKISLPECYKSFIQYVGNGGISHAGSAAGPFYGIYALGTNLDELVFGDPRVYLNRDCKIHPRMTDGEWSALTKDFDGESFSLDRFEELMGSIYGGILVIGSQGCSYCFGIVLNGEYRGRVVNMDYDRIMKPIFAFEDNFLDWYERWLDEVICGHLLIRGPNWFGYSKGGTEEYLLQCFANAGDDNDRTEALNGLLNKHKLSQSSLVVIESLFVGNEAFRPIFIKLLCKFDYQRAKPYLEAFFKTDMDTIVYSIWVYARDKSKEWYLTLVENIEYIDSRETLRNAILLLKESGKPWVENIIPFTKNHSVQIRIEAFQFLGQYKKKKDFLETFIEGLADKSSDVIVAVLRALYDLYDSSLLAHYKNIAEKFTEEQSPVISSLNLRLAEVGLTNRSILHIDPFNYKATAPKSNRRKWYQWW